MTLSRLPNSSPRHCVGKPSLTDWSVPNTEEHFPCAFWFLFPTLWATQDGEERSRKVQHTVAWNVYFSAMVASILKGGRTLWWSCFQSLSFLHLGYYSLVHTHLCGEEGVTRSLGRWRSLQGGTVCACVWRCWEEQEVMHRAGSHQSLQKFGGSERGRQPMCHQRQK